MAWERGRGSRSVHELRVAFGPRDDHVHPDPHGLRGRRHHEVKSVVGLDAEGEGGVRALEGEKEAGSERRSRGRGRRRQEACHLCGAAEVVVINFFYSLEVDDALQLGLVFVWWGGGGRECKGEEEKKKSAGGKRQETRTIRKTLIINNLGFAVMDGERQAQHFCSSLSGGAHCVFTFLRYASTRLQRVSSAAAELAEGTGGELSTRPLPPGTNTPPANFKSSR